MIEEELPYYYNHNGKWCSVVAIDKQIGKIVVSTEILCEEQQKKFSFRYDDAACFIADLNKLHDRGEIFLRGEASPPRSRIIMKSREAGPSEGGPSEKEKKEKTRAT